MVGHFAGLKWRLVRNGLSRGWQQAVGLAVGLVLAVPLALVAGLGLAFERGSPGHGSLLVMGSLGLLLAWAVLPVLGFGSDETLDAARLVYLPLRPGQLQAGLFTASLIGVPGLATVIVVVLGLGGVLRPDVGGVIAVLAAGLVVAQSVVGSRAVVTSLSGLLRSRRGRDVTALLIALVVVGAQGLRFIAAGVASAIGSDGLRRTAGFAKWLPPAWAGEALAGVVDDRLGHALLALAGAGAFLVALVAWWRLALARVLSSADTSGTPNTARRRFAGLSLFPVGVGFLPRSRIGAVVAKELRYAWRDPRRRVQVVVNLAMPAAGIALLAVQPRSFPTEVLLAASVGSLVALNSLNFFGLDGPAYWVHVMAGGDPRQDLIGKDLALLGEVIPLVTLAAFVLAAISGGWIYVPAALVLAAPVVGVQAAVGNVVSVVLPQPLPQGSNPWAANSGQGCVSGLLVMGAMFVELLLLVPIAVSVSAAAVVAPGWLLVVIPAVCVYGATLWCLGLGVAVGQLRGREPELLAKVDVRAIA